MSLFFVCALISERQQVKVVKKSENCFNLMHEHVCVCVIVSVRVPRRCCEHSKAKARAINCNEN